MNGLIRILSRLVMAVFFIVITSQHVANRVELETIGLRFHWEPWFSWGVIVVSYLGALLLLMGQVGVGSILLIIIEGGRVYFSQDLSQLSAWLEPGVLYPAGIIAGLLAIATPNVTLKINEISSNNAVH